jgi:hypothetical protein
VRREVRGNGPGAIPEPRPGPTQPRLIEFGPHAALNRKARGEGKPETFTFLGFRHITRMTRQGRFWARRITDKKKIAAKLKSVKAELMRRRYLPTTRIRHPWPEARFAAGTHDRSQCGNPARW